MLGVLAIIGVLSVGGIAGYSKAMQKYRINKTIEQITLIAGNVRSFFAPQRNYDGLSSTSDTGKAIIKKAKLVPDEMWDGDSIINVFGDNVFLYSANKAKTGDKQAFYLYFDVVLDKCIELTTQDWSNAGVNYIEIGPSFAIQAKIPLPTDFSTAFNACSNTFGNNPQVTWPLNFYFDIDVNSTYWQSKINPS